MLMVYENMSLTSAEKVLFKRVVSDYPEIIRALGNSASSFISKLRMTDAESLIYLYGLKSYRKEVLSLKKELG